MRIGIAGYGNMGKLIRQQALASGHEVPAVVDPCSEAVEVTTGEFICALLPLDVIIDFTAPDAVIDNIRLYGELQVSAVIRTTGWYDNINQVAAIVDKTGIGLIWSGNFSLGANLFFRIVKTAGNIMNQFPQYDASHSEFIVDPHLPRSVYEVEGAERCAIEINSFSKFAGFTGVRLGWSIVLKTLVAEESEPGELHKIWLHRQTTFFNGASNIAQRGGIAVLSDQGLKENAELIGYYMENARLGSENLSVKYRVCRASLKTSRKNV